jgi:hypothetical protein
MAAIKRRTPGAQRISDALEADPTVASKTLAKRLFKKFPKSWPTLNACVLAVRRHRGAQGELQRQGMPYVARSKEDAESCRKWGALIPEQIKNTWAWQKLPEGPKRWLAVSDIHLNFHDSKAIKAAMEKTHGECDAVLINGVALDCYAFSHFERDPEKIDFDGELDSMERLLDSFAYWGAKKIVYKMGNHELRLERYLIQKAQELLASRRIREKLNLSSFLDLEQRGVKVVDAMDPIIVGKLCILHGHEMGKGISSPVNPARGVYLRGRECCLIGHQHRTSEHTEMSMLGTTVTTWSTGCLCDLHPRYAAMNKWNHGFAVLDLHKKGEWRIENYRILDGKVL